MQTESRSPAPFDPPALAHRHLRFGWYSLLCFLTLGMALELFHGFKLDFYLNLANETRRLMWTLAHAHGTLLALVNIAFAVTVPHLAGADFRRRKFISACLTGATVVLPAGFFLGGIFVYGGDPGLSILLVPIGAVLLLISVLLIARSLGPRPWLRTAHNPPPAPAPAKKR